MSSCHRYAQFCPMARAAEVLAQRWSPLVVRELLLGPQRFSDLKRRLRGVSTSVLTNRLAALETQGIVARRVLEAPAASSVYALTETGRALEPVLIEMTRFGMRLMTPPEPGDHIEPDWFLLAMDAFARRDATPERCFEVRMTNGERWARARVGGGADGTRRLAHDDPRPVDLTISAPVLLMMMFTARVLPIAAVRAHPEVALEGNEEALADFPALFEMPAPTPREGTA